VLWLPKKYDRILVYQVSPIFQIIPALFAAWRFDKPPFVNVQDLWPETLASTRQGKNPLLLKGVSAISDYLYRKADFLLLPFKSSQLILEQRGVQPQQMAYLPNSIDDFYLPVSADPLYEYLFTGDTHILLTGNLGEAQGIDLIVEAAYRLKEKYPRLRWILVGEGRSRKELEQLVKDRGMEEVVLFPGRFPASVMPALIARADASLLTLKKEPIFAITVPNRLQSYMACGKPILASIDGEAAGIISAAKCGLVAPAGDLSEFISIVENFIETSSVERETWGDNARAYFLKHFERKKILNQLDELLLMK
jgi:glycosyltransferase involved in cell wall biosynthesis